MGLESPPSESPVRRIVPRNTALLRAAALALGVSAAAPLASALSAQQRVAPAPRVRNPAQVMSFRGAEWLERPQRVSEERPDEVLDVMALGPGDVVADIGAGSGYFTRRMAPQVAPGGTVFAVDVQNEMLDLLMESLDEPAREIVVPLLGEEADPHLPAGEVDWMLLVDVYHEFAQPRPMLTRLREALAPGGRVALLEYRAEDQTGDNIRAEHRMSVRQVIAEWNQAGFELAELHEFLPSQHLFVLRVAGRGESTAAFPHYDLLEAMRAGVVEVTMNGRGAEAMTLTIRRTRPGAMVVTLPAGATFSAPGAPSDMIARRDGYIVLTEDAPRAWNLAVRKADPAASAPRPGEPIELTSYGSQQVADLMWLLQGSDVNPAVAPTVEQIAVYIVTADAGWAALSAHARSTSVHAANAVALASAYVNRAGIDIKSKRIWSERASFASDISDAGLRRIFQELEAN